MKGIIRFSLNNKIAILILTFIVVFAGLYAGTRMKMETLPDISVPIITVTAIYPGAAPQQVQDKVTIPIEQQLRNLESVTSVSSTSMDNAASIMIEYDYSKNMDDAYNEAREAISKVKLPQDAQEPTVSRLSLNAFPILSLSVSKEGSDLAELTGIVVDDILPAIQGQDGVASVQVTGQYLEEVELTFNQARMAELGLTEQTVQGIIQGSAVTFPLGIINFGTVEKSVIIDGNIHSLQDLGNIDIPVMNGQEVPTLSTVKLTDIATLNLIGKAESISRTNGQESIGISVVKAADANTVDVVNRVKDLLDDFEQHYEGISVVPTFDQGQPIEDSVNTMLNKALMGALFAVLIIMLFLRNIRTTIIAVVSIPLSLLIAILILNEMDITLNIMTLGAMTVAVGRVIDDSIVVIENIYRRMTLSTEKLQGKQLILESTREIFKPIASSTIVTIAVFLPIGLVTGPIGEIFLPFALTIVFALLASLLVAITIVPAMAHWFFAKGVKAKKHDEHPGKLAGVYKRTLNWSLNHKFMTFGMAVILLVGSLFLAPIIGFSFLPSEEEKMLIATFNPAPGETLEQVEEMALQAEKLLLDRENVTTVQYSVGGQNPMNPGASKQALYFINYDKDTPAFTEEKEAVIAALQELDPQGTWKEMDMAGGGLGGSQMNLIVYGSSMDELQPVVSDIMNIMGANDSLKNIDSSISEAFEQYRLVIDSEKASQYGLSAATIAMQLSPVQQRPVLTTIEKDGKDLNVYISVEQKHYESKTDLGNTIVMSPMGIPVAVKDVAVFHEELSPDTITRKDNRIYAQVTADITVSDVSKVSSDVQQVIDQMNLPPHVDVEIGGVTQQMNESFSQLGLAMLAAVAIVYLILVITFGGALTPLAILFSLPFTVIGGLVGLWIAGETISVTAMIGALMLIGIVVTNAIVLIDRVIIKEKEGLSVRDALLEAAGTRLRPILMTAIATIFALLPLALGFESGGLISKGLGITVIGGLASSTLLTLLVVPVVYEFFHRTRTKSAAEDN